MLHVAAARAAVEPEGLLVRYAVTIAVAVDVEIIAICLGDDDAVIERQHDARQEKFVGEYRMPVVDAVAVGILMARNAAERLLLAGAVGVHHVGAHLGDVHPAIAIEGDHHRLGDLGLGQHRLEPVAFRHLHRGDGGFGRQSRDRRGLRGGDGFGRGAGQLGRRRTRGQQEAQHQGRKYTHGFFGSTHRLHTRSVPRSEDHPPGDVSDTQAVARDPRASGAISDPLTGVMVARRLLARTHPRIFDGGSSLRFTERHLMKYLVSTCVAVALLVGCGERNQSESPAASSVPAASAPPRATICRSVCAVGAHTRQHCHRIAGDHCFAECGALERLRSGTCSLMPNLDFTSMKKAIAALQTPAAPARISTPRTPSTAILRARHTTRETCSTRSRMPRVSLVSKLM